MRLKQLHNEKIKLKPNFDFKARNSNININFFRTNNHKKKFMINFLNLFDFD